MDSLHSLLGLSKTNSIYSHFWTPQWYFWAWNHHPAVRPSGARQDAEQGCFRRVFCCSFAAETMIGCCPKKFIFCRVSGWKWPCSHGNKPTSELAVLPYTPHGRGTHLHEIEFLSLGVASFSWSFEFCIEWWKLPWKSHDSSMNGKLDGNCYLLFIIFHCQLPSYETVNPTYKPFPLEVFFF